MKKLFLTLAFFALSFMLLATLPTWAQQEPNTKDDSNLPPSMRYELKKEVPEIFFDFPDKAQKTADSLRKTWHPVTLVHEIKQEINFMKKAVCEKLPNGDKVYRLKFNCDAVLDILYFKDLEIPKGAAIYAVYPQKNMARPINTQANAVGDKELWGYDLSSVIIEYVQPKRVKQKPKIILRNLSLRYSQNDIRKDAEDEQDLICNPLIRCSLAEYNANGFPMSDALKDLLAMSVVKIRIYEPISGCPTAPDASWECTGTFINSTDKRLFILTAEHNLMDCYEAGSLTNPVKLRIRFNHELLECDENSGAIGTNYPQGTGINSSMDAFLVARNPDSDMALLEIMDIPETIADIYMASFDNLYELPSEGFAIHHPEGAVKRIGIQADYLNPEIDDGIIACNPTGQATMAGINSVGAANPDGVFFATNFDVGTPAGGSSGSPYFNIYGSILGQLNGGPAFCGGVGETYVSYYGRLWHSWGNGYDFNQNGTVEIEEAVNSTLQPHLDPYFITDGYMPVRLHNYDLAMIDDVNDDLQEPNQSTPNFFNSPDIINCIGQSGTGDCTDDVPTWEQEENTIKINVSNLGNYPPTPGAVVEAYWTIASTGEMWPEHWIDQDLTDDCVRGNLIGEVPIPSDLETFASLELPWTAPDYANILPCLSDSDEDPFLAPTAGEFGDNYQLCYLARIVDYNDPIIGERAGPILNNVQNSNNVVTQNSFLIYVDGYEQPPLSPGGTVYPVLILVENNNDFLTSLNITIEKVTTENVGDLGDYVYLEVLLSQDLWDKWESTGFKGEGVTIIGEQKVRVLDLEAAKLLDIPFDAKEFLTLGLKATSAYTSGKKMSANIPSKYTFSVTHEATNAAQKINSPSPCNFTFKGLDKLHEVIGVEQATIKCYPNPTNDQLQIEVLMPTSDNINLVLFDIHGRKVADIAQNEKKNVGKHLYKYSMNNLPNGTYICYLQTSNYTENKKIIKIE